MRLVATSIAALALIVTPARVHAQEIWDGAAPPPPSAAPPPRLPAPFAPRPVRRPMRNPPLMIIGIVFGLAGTGLLAAGVVGLDSKSPTCVPMQGGPPLQSIGAGIGDAISALGNTMAVIVGGGLWATGAVLTPIGAAPGKPRYGAASVTLALGSVRLTLPF